MPGLKIFSEQRIVNPYLSTAIYHLIQGHKVAKTESFTKDESAFVIPTGEESPIYQPSTISVIRQLSTVNYSVEPSCRA